MRLCGYIGLTPGQPDREVQRLVRNVVVELN